jgi:hypothetical protein
MEARERRGTLLLHRMLHVIRLVYRGRGLFVLLFACSFFAIQALVDTFYTDGFYEHTLWPKLAAGFLAALPLWFLGRYWNRPRTVANRTGARAVAVRERHELFYVPVEYWSIPMLLVMIAQILASSSR